MSFRGKAGSVPRLMVTRDRTVASHGESITYRNTPMCMYIDTFAHSYHEPQRELECKSKHLFLSRDRGKNVKLA